MSRKSNLTNIIRELFALSGNRCSFPGCTHRLINEDGTYIAEICHIEAANPNGQRYNPSQNDEERRSAANLILLCHEHHKVTDDEKKYPVPTLKEMKKLHENKFRNAPYAIDESVLKELVDDLQNKLDGLIKVSTDTNATVHTVDQKIDQLIQQLTAFSIADNNKLYIAELDTIRDLRKQGKVKTMIDMLLKFKEKNWSKLNPETKYKVIGNLANCYLSLNKKKEFAEITKELDSIQQQTPEIVSLRLLGYAVGEDFIGFDAYFEKAATIAKDNSDLWVAYIERHKKNKTSFQFLTEIPASALESGNVIFHLGQLTIEEGRKKEGIELIKKGVSKLDSAEEKLSDTNALIATYLLQDLVKPHKFLFKNYTVQEKKDLEEARRLFTKSWEDLKNTELAPSKWYILLNRGVVNKILGNIDEAITDFQKAYELSLEYLPYKNLLVGYIEMGNVSAAEKLLSDPKYISELPQEEREINQTFRAKLLIKQGKIMDAISFLSALLKKEKGASGDLELYGIIISTCLQYNATEVAKNYLEELIKAFPDDPNGYLFSGLINIKSDKAQSLEDYDKAASLITDNSPVNILYELASGYSDLGEYEKAIPQFKKIADLSVYNDFTKGLIYAVYQAGDLDKALTLAKNLYKDYPAEPFLAEIIGNIYDETKRFDDAINITESFQEKSIGSVKDYFSFRAAKMYSHKNDWPNVRRMANQVKDLSRAPLSDIFTLAYLLVKSGEKENGMRIAYEARTKFFDNSEAHLKYISLAIGNGEKHEDLFPEKVSVDNAVMVRTENGSDDTYLITEKSSRGENILKPSDEFAVKLLGKKVGDELMLTKGYGIEFKVTVTGIMTIYVQAFRESLRLFETRFAGLHSVGVFRANPGQPDDQIEQVIKNTSLSGNEFQKQVYDIYNKRIATIGVLAGLFKRNMVKQWMALVSSQDVFLYSYSHNELPAVEKSITQNKVVVLDITSLLTNFFMLPDTILFNISNKEIYVTQSTIDELKEFYDEMEIHVKEGVLSMGYQDGRMVGHSMSSEEVIKQRQKISDIIQWCKNNAQISIPSDLIKIKRKDRQKTAGLFGDCFFDTALLARELNATVISDDDAFKNLLNSEYGVNSFSTFQLALSEARDDRLSNDSFEKFTLQCILGNYVFLPVNAEILWKIFDFSGFQIRKPFTTAVKGLHIMELRMITSVISRFFKKLYLEAGLVTTREQTVLAVLGEMFQRPDFLEFKKLLFSFLQRDLRQMQPALKNLLQFLNNF